MLAVMLILNLLDLTVFVVLHYRGWLLQMVLPMLTWTVPRILQLLIP